MLDFVKYISPSWYFNKQIHNKSYFVDFTMLDAKIIENCSLCVSYSNEIAKKIDIAFQLWKQGYITDEISKELQWNENDVSLKDKYIFINRFYKKHWSFVVLFFRLLEFNNPFAEILSFCQTRKIKKVQSNYSFVYEVENSLTNVLNYKPLVSVIIPTLNRYKYLKDVLLDLEKQTYKSFEVIVFDQSEPFHDEFYQNWKFDLKVVHQKEKALWLARNSAIKMALGKFVLLYDDDSLIDENWILNHLNCIDYFNCDISSGVSISVVGGDVPKHYSYFRWSEQVDTGNVMIKREVFEKIGLFDRQFEGQRMGDGEFGLRAYLGGFKNISNPLAKRVHLKGSEGGLRHIGMWDAWHTSNFFGPKPVPSVLYLIRKYFGNKNAYFEIFVKLPTTLAPYKFKNNKKINLLLLPFSLFLLPIFIFSLFKSWKISNDMLKSGSLIDNLTQ
jgi:glycosyltransferase involved in cell wall biosynthesis